MELYLDLCRRLLELILNTTIKKISYPEREKTIEARTDSEGIFKLPIPITSSYLFAHSTDLRAEFTHILFLNVAIKILISSLTTVPLKFS